MCMIGISTDTDPAVRALMLYKRESVEVGLKLDGAGGERVVGQDVEERRIGQLGGNLDKEGISRQETTKRDG